MNIGGKVFMSNLFDKTTQALGSAINFRGLRQSVVTSNVANAETPGYKAKKLDFEGALKRAIDLESLKGPSDKSLGHFVTGEGSIRNVRADVYDNPDGVVSNDGNTVDLEKEMAKLSENTILYKATIQLINKKLGQLKYVSSDALR